MPETLPAYVEFPLVVFMSIVAAGLGLVLVASLWALVEKMVRR